MGELDVVVVGGGPGGSIVAAELRRRGLSVVIYEKAAFPRFHLGESLLPHTLPVLEAIGVLPAVRAAFLAKYGARFHDDIGGRTERFSFDSAWRRGFDHAFQVPRDSFDALLLDHARSLGAVVHERTAVRRIVRDGSGRAAGVEVDGESVPARWVIDASGRDALSAHDRGAATRIEGLDQTALYAHFTGVPREAGTQAGDIEVVLFPSGDAGRSNWFWFIPFADGRTSVGAVVAKSWIQRNRGAHANATALFDQAVRESPSAARLLANATRQWPNAEAAADFSYRVAAPHGPGWLAVGDAGGFIDPLFSTGVHLAAIGGYRAADAIARALASPADEQAIVAAWADQVSAAAETFVTAVQAFYVGPLVDHLFAPDKHAVLRRSITSLLAGDVFDDAIWLRDMRPRLRAMAQA